MDISICRIVVVLLFISISSSAEDVNLETLKLVQLIFRHGERVPEYPYPTDPYNNETFWEEGWGQLTNKGKKQEYQLGQYLRSRYKDFISTDFVPEEVYALSSDMDRTIISAQLCLAGLFPTENGTDWNPDLKWQPIPLHTIATENDNVIRFKRSCPKFDELFHNALYNTPEIQKINEDNKDLYQYLSNHSGVEITNIDQIDSFYATMMVEELLGLDLPEWAVDVIHKDNFQYLYNLSFAIRSSTPELKRLRSGVLLGDLVENVNTKVTNSSMKTKFFMYSGHDTTLVNILNTLQVLDLQRPDYASVFMVELHKNSSEYFVNILLRNNTQREPYKLHIPGCQFDCPLDTFLQYSEPLIPKDWDAECKIGSGDDSSKSSVAYYVAVIATGIIILGFAIYLFLIVLKKKNRRTTQNDYERF